MPAAIMRANPQFGNPGSAPMPPSPVSTLAGTEPVPPTDWSMRLSPSRSQATGQRIIGNSVYRNVTAGINLEGGSSSGLLANNISVDNGDQQPTDQQQHPSRLLLDQRNLDRLRPGVSASGHQMVIWGSTFYSSLAALGAATGQEVHGIQADPRWAGPDAGDLHLLAGSPAIDSANSGVPGEPVSDGDGNPRVDDPATPNSGARPRPYDDRGAYEYQPGSSVDAPPTASLVVTPSSGSAPLQVAADASGSSDTDATPIESYAFDFGDGSSTVGPQAGATANHTYPGSGTYAVTVTVTDTANQPSTASTQVTIQDTSNQNLVGNPGFETATSGWNTSGSGVSCSLARTSGGHSGSFSAALTNTSAAAGNCTLNDSPNWVPTTTAGTYTGTIWVRADAGGTVLKLRFREYAGSTLAGSATTQMTLGTSWQQVTVTYTVASPASSTLDFNAYVSTLGPSASFYADDASISAP
jgi:hypothetical protein